MSFKATYYDSDFCGDDIEYQTREIHSNPIRGFLTIEEAFDWIRTQWSNSPHYKYLILTDSNQEITPRELTKAELLNRMDFYINLYKQNGNQLENKITFIPNNLMPIPNAARNVFTVVGIEHAEPKMDQSGNDVTPDSLIVLPLTTIIAKDENHARTVATATIVNSKKDVNLKNLEIKVKGF